MSLPSTSSDEQADERERLPLVGRRGEDRAGHRDGEHDASDRADQAPLALPREPRRDRVRRPALGSILRASCRAYDRERPDDQGQPDDECDPDHHSEHGSAYPARKRNQAQILCGRFQGPDT